MNKLNLSLDTWIISDTHFNHDNIVRYCNRPLDHTEIMIDRWNRFVKDDDQVLHLGDIILGKRDVAYRVLSLLKGEKFFIRGNHDRQTEEWYYEHGFTEIEPFFWWHGKAKVYFSHLPDMKERWTINIHGHIHNNGYSEDTPRYDYRNVSVEVMDYRPARLKQVLDGVSYQPRP